MTYTTILMVIGTKVDEYEDSNYESEDDAIILS